MSFTSDCPQCRKPVTVPDGACAEALVRCPLCTAEYPLHEVLAAAPPALIVVGMAATPGAAAAMAAFTSVPPPPPMRSQEEFAAQASEEPVAFESAEGDVPALAEHEPLLDESGGEAGSWGAAWKEVPEGETAETGIDPGVYGDAVDVSAITGKSDAPMAGRSAETLASPPDKPRPRRRRPREPHPVRFFIGIMVSGALALVVGYYAINFFGGPKYDMAKIRLPGVPHTAKYWCWYWPFGNADENGAEGATAGTPADANKTANGNGEPSAKTDAAAANNGTDTATPNVQTPIPGDPSVPPTVDPANVDPANVDPAKTDALPAPAPAKTVDPFDLDTEPKPEPKEDHPFPTPEVDPSLPMEIPFGKSDPNDKPEAKTETDPQPEKLKPEDDPFAEPPVTAKTEGKTESKTESQPEVKPIPEPKVEPGDDPFAQPLTPEPKTEGKTESPFDPEPKMQPEPTPVEPKAEPKLEPDPTPVEPKLDPEPVKPEVKPEPKPADALGPRQAATVEAAELEKLVKTAASAYTDDVTAEAYEKLRQMAEAATLVKPDTDAAALTAQKQAVQDLIQRVGKSPQGPEKLAALAKKLMEDAASTGGVVFSGTILKVGAKGGLHAAGVKLDGDSKPLTVFSSQPLGSENDRVIIVGILVRDPAKNLAGYSGTQPLVVWSGMTVKIP